jgi:adenine modification enzyme
MKKDLIYSEQQTLWGAREVIGFGSKEWHVKEIERDLAYEIIIKNHYSKKGDSIAHNKINLGVFVKGELLGVLQYGYAMNPASCDSVVEGTQIDEYLELNRMWLSDKAERNSESKALSYSFRYIRSRHKKIKWIQSFADERCGGLGIVYQASNFNYYGLHVSTFWEINGEVYHNSILTNGKRKAKAKLENKLKDAKKMELRQFRYLFFIDKRWEKNCLLKKEPYLKHYNGD